MLSDAVRTLAYERALQALIQPHHRVLDFGCGTGILSFFAHRAGASRIYAVDRSQFIGAAQAVARLNRFDRIEFFYGEDDVTLPTPVDVIVSEWMGHFVFNESMLEPLVRMRSRSLARGGIMIPRRLSLYAGVVTDSTFITRYQYFQNRPYGIDFSPMIACSFARTEARNLGPEQVSSTLIPLGSLDMQTCRETPQVLAGSAAFARPTVAYGLTGWFDADLAEGVSFGTGPFSPRTHWQQLGFPLPEPFPIAAGDPVHVRIEPITVEDDRRHWRWSIRQGTREIEQDELKSKPWAAEKPGIARRPSKRAASRSEG
jgi:type I protein arginine methyltransferase